MGPTDKSPGSDSQGVAGDRGNRWGLLQCCTAAAPESHRPHPPDSGVPPRLARRPTTSARARMPVICCAIEWIHAS